MFNYVKIIIIETFNVIKDNIFNKFNYIITNIKLIKEIININNDLIVLDLTENNLLNNDIDIDNLELNIKFISNILNKFNNLYKIYENDKNKSIETMEKIKDIYDMLNDYEFTFDIENDFYNKLEEYNKKKYNFKKIDYISNKVRKIENNNNCYYFNYYNDNDNNSDIDEYNSESDNDEENKND